MLYVCSSLKHYQQFREQFQPTLNLARIPSERLAEECESIVNHHSKGTIFLGYLEAGWMLSPTDQTRMRKLLRKFDVGLVCQFPESLPHSWKTELHTFYVESLKDGHSRIIHDGGSV